MATWSFRTFTTAVIGCGLLSSASAQETPLDAGMLAAPEVEDCGVFYAADLEAAYEAQLRRSPADLYELEAQYRRHPRRFTAALALAKAYVSADRYEDARLVVDPFVGRWRGGQEAYELLAAIQFETGDYYKAEATAAAGLRRFERSRAAEFILAAARIRLDRYASLEQLLADVQFFDNRLRLATQFSLERGDVVNALLTHEQAYLTQGYRSIRPAEVERIDHIYNGLLRAVAAGDTVDLPDYPDAFAAVYHRELLRATADALADIGSYASRLELIAAIRSGVLHRVVALEPFGDEAMPRRLLALDRGGWLRWLTMARLREIDPLYFDAVVCEHYDTWQAVRGLFAPGRTPLTAELPESALEGGPAVSSAGR